MSRVAQVVQQQSERTGLSVSIKKKVDERTYLPVEESDLKAADFDIKMGQVVETVSKLPRDEKIKFSKAMRDAGNERFAEADYVPALEMYAQAMAGFDCDSGEKLYEAKQEIALPILTNMAVCLLELRKPTQALQVCDEALAIQPRNAKALVRKGKALLALDRYAEAKQLFEEARNAENTDERFVSRQIRYVNDTTKRVKRVTNRHKLRLKEEFGAIYADKLDRSEIMQKRRNACLRRNFWLVAWLQSPGVFAETNAGDLVLVTAFSLFLLYVLFGEQLAVTLLSYFDRTLRTPYTF